MFTNQKCASVSDLRSDHKPLCLSRRLVDGVMLEFARKRDLWLGGFLSRCHNIMSFKTSLLDTLFWGPRLVTIQRLPESPMLRVYNWGDPCDCERVTDAERRLDAARSQIASCRLSLCMISMSRAGGRCLSVKPWFMRIFGACGVLSSTTRQRYRRKGSGPPCFVSLESLSTCVIPAFSETLKVLGWKIRASGVALFKSTSRRISAALTLSVLEPLVSFGGSG